MTDEQIDIHLVNHVIGGDVQPAACKLCRLTWHYVSPARRVAYTITRYVFGRGLPDEA